MSDARAAPGIFITETSNGVHPISSVTTSETAFIDIFKDGPLNEATRVTGFREFREIFGGLEAGSEASYAIQAFFDNSGQAAWVVRVPDAEAATLIGSEADGSGIFALDRIAPAVFSLMCIPAAANLMDGGRVRAAAAEYCLQKRAFFLADIPQHITTPAAMQEWRRGITGPWESNAAVYFPRLVVVDELNPLQNRNIGTSGALAGLYAQTDASRGVWKSPAGLNAPIRGAEPAVNVFDAQIAALNAAGINVLRNLPGVGAVAWGARTLAGADAQTSEWKYVSVRRTALYIEESLSQGLQWVIFEPNDELLWESIRVTVGTFLNGLFAQGAFQGAKPEEAYFVRCGRDTMTQNDLDEDIVKIVVGFAPLKPAEFVVIQISQLAGQAG